MEAGAAYLEVAVPEAGGIVREGGDVEAVEAVDSLGAHVLAVELPFGGVDLEGGGMVFGNLVTLEYHGEMEGVAGTPYTPFTVDAGLEALLERLASNVEAAEGVFVAVGHLEVGGGAAAACHQGERLSAELQLAGAVDLAGADLAQLEVVSLDVGAHRLGVDDVAGCEPDLVASGVLGGEAQVGSHEVDLRETIVDVIRRMVRVLGFFPVVFAPVAAIPVIRIGSVPDLAVGDGSAYLVESLPGDVLFAIYGIVLIE